MTQHLSDEEIELLSKYQLKGKRLPEALSHIESCAECRTQVKSPTKAEIIERLRPDEKEMPAGENIDSDANSEADENTKSGGNQSRARNPKPKQPLQLKLARTD